MQESCECVRADEHGALRLQGSIKCELTHALCV